MKENYESKMHLDKSEVMKQLNGDRFELEKKLASDY
jgi:hypothetical protein